MSNCNYFWTLWLLVLSHTVIVLYVVAFSFVSHCDSFWTLWHLALCHTVTFLDVVAFRFVSHCNTGQVSGRYGFRFVSHSRLTVPLARIYETGKKP